MTKLIAMIFTASFFVTCALAQVRDPMPTFEKQVAAPLPKLALMGAVGVRVGRKEFHKITFSVTNRDRYLSSMFGAEPYLPLNPCGPKSTRMVVSIYDDHGGAQTRCRQMNTRDSLGDITLLIEKGKPVPDYIYVVLTDLKTGAPYRSNLVSPWTGLTK